MANFSYVNIGKALKSDVVRETTLAVVVIFLDKYKIVLRFSPLILCSSKILVLNSPLSNKFDQIIPLEPKVA